MVWGAPELRSCAALLERVEKNDSSFEELVILSTKCVTQSDWERLIQSIQKHGDTRTLKSIRASGHSLKLPIAFQLGKAIHESSQHAPWRLLAVGDCQMGESDGLETLVAGLDSPSETLRLHELDLSYKGLTRANLGAVLQLTTRCNQIKNLDLSRNPGLFSPLLEDGGSDTSSQLFPYIQNLNLSANDMDGNSARSLLKGLSQSNSCHNLNLSENLIGTQPFDVIGACPTSIRELHLANCFLDDASFASIAQEKTLCIESLDLSNNQLTSKSIVNLASWLSSGHSSMLRSLNVSGNTLGLSGVTTLVLDGLVQRIHKDPQSRLRSLDLSQTQCGVQGAIIAVENSRVDSLRLFDNQLGDPGFEALAPFLVNGNETLETLDLAGNGASEAAVVGLLRGLLCVDDLKNENISSKLKTIIVGGNSGGMELESLVHEIHKLRPDLDIARDRNVVRS